EGDEKLRDLLGSEDWAIRYYDNNQYAYVDIINNQIKVVWKEVGLVEANGSTKIKDLKLIGLAATDDQKNGIRKISTFSAEYKDNISFTIDIDPVLDVKTFLNEEDYLNIFAKKSNDYKNMVNE
ncbi:8416_t:CDS:2, partial [Entrophospora sp. SA101]